MLPPVLSGLSGSVAAMATNLSYPILDILLLAVILAACAVFRSHPPPGLWWLGVGVALLAVLDSIWVVQFADDSYWSGGFVDGAWVVTATITALASGRHRRPSIARVPNAVSIAVPFIATCVAVTVAILHRPHGINPSRDVSRSRSGGDVDGAHTGRVPGIGTRRRARLSGATDELTGLPNRRGFYAERSRCYRPRTTKQVAHVRRHGAC